MGFLNRLQEALGFNNQNKEEYGSMTDSEDYRVLWNPDFAEPGDTLRINYQGLLKNSGAQEVFLYYGFDRWNSAPQTVKMEQQKDGVFGANIKAQGNEEINFCFKDAGGNWDNNNGDNWTIFLH